MTAAEAVLLSILQTVPMSSEVTLEGVYCMAEAVFFEASSEGIEGQVAVANNIWNRRNSLKHFKNQDTICDVVQAKYQYSYRWDGNSTHIELANPIDAKVWKQSIYASIGVINGWYADNTYGSLYYFNPKLASPSWASRMVVTTTIKGHRYLKHKD